MATPPRGPVAGGTVVLLYGKRFVDGFAAFGGSQASLQTTVAVGGNSVIDPMVIDDNRIEIRTPPGQAGDTDIVVTNPNGTATCAKCFRFYEVVTVASVQPAQGSTRGGEPISVVGGGFSAGALVLVGGREATGVVVAADGKSLTGSTPPGQAGGADVEVVGPNSSGRLRRAFVYIAPMRLYSVDPSGGAAAGGTAVVLTGEGFTADTTVAFDGAAATGVSFVSETEIRATTPAGPAGHAATVKTTARRGQQASLAGAFAWWSAASRDTVLLAVSPRRGPVQGGTCAAGPATCLTLVGNGFTAADLEVRVGGRAAQVAQVVDDRTVRVDLPPGDPGPAAVQVRTARGGAVLDAASDGAFSYVVPLALGEVQPKEGAASGSPATTVTITGTGLSADCRVSIGAGEATVLSASADGTQLVATAPSGSSGSADVRVSCGDPGSASFLEAALAGAFEFTAPLSILHVEPDSGAIAGNTSVDVLGGGFRTGLQVIFGRSAASTVDVKSPHLATVRTPRGDEGTVDVTVKLDGAQEVLRAGYGYTDPTNLLGGGSGGPMRGILNVTVWNSTQGMSGPVDGATVSVNGDQLTGLTDDRGQVTFSDPLLLKPVTITSTKDKFAPSTIARIDARNVTILMQMNELDGDPSMPPGVPGAVFRGRVCGFKKPASLQLGDGQHLEARVWASAPYVFAAPPFRYQDPPVVVSSDCGTYALSPRRFGAMAIYAEYGIADESEVALKPWTPLLMGIRRGQEASPSKVVDGLDIVLDMHRDLDVPVVVQPARTPPGALVANLIFSYLDLGGDGAIVLGEEGTFSNSFVFGNHPREGGEGLIFLNVATVLDSTGNPGPPFSFFYRRQYGDPAAGVQIGPMLSFTQLRSPAEGGTFTGALGWGFHGGEMPDVQQITVEQPLGLGSKPIWDVVLPGSEVSVTLPPTAMSRVPEQAVLFWTVITAKSPRLDFDRFGYQQLSVLDWTAFTQDWSMATTP